MLDAPKGGQDVVRRDLVRPVDEHRLGHVIGYSDSSVGSMLRIRVASASAVSALCGRMSATPLTTMRASLIDDPDAPAWVEHVNAAFQRLNDVLFGPQDYAVIARTAPAAGH